MAKPTHRTVSTRAIVQGVIAPLLLPDTTLPQRVYRRVQILTPAAPLVVMSIDSPSGLEAGPSRMYMLPPLPPGQLVRFNLLPDQTLYAGTADGEGLAIVGLICEYLTSEG